MRHDPELLKLAEWYEDLSFKVHKMGEVLINDKISETLTPDQGAILRYLYKNQPCTSSSLSKAFYVKKSAITAIINRLFKKELIKRERSEDDRRVVYLLLTDKGEQLYMETSQQSSHIVASLMSQFDDEEIRSFMNTYEKLANTLEQQIENMKGVEE
ncbi:MarR family winged helix-turn-helix transcriptional regulator [Tuberibacillus sp. Marseille-P3662]|uniref:MarR family winged helix-turn-helix transcriptional regulator n=1 Tax=Tuberibacillus sp. Marseille-P3662 TaxID=1965358 RepID=UPI000A1C8309|nr:MarR family transcriptional regulator [Tuberibacillus sp. Marseille-P3662]